MIKLSFYAIRFSRRTLTFVMLTLIVAASQVTAAEHILCGEWKTRLPYKAVPGRIQADQQPIEGPSLIMTEREITWPGCAAAAYTIMQMPDEAGLWLDVPRLECDKLPKGSGQGYLIKIEDRFGYSWKLENFVSLSTNVFDRGEWRKGSAGTGLRTAQPSGSSRMEKRISLAR